MTDRVQYETRRELANRSRLSERYFEKLAETGDGPPFIRVGRRVLYPVAQADAWLHERIVASTAEAALRQREAAA